MIRSEAGHALYMIHHVAYSTLVAGPCGTAAVRCMRQKSQRKRQETIDKKDASNEDDESGCGSLEPQPPTVRPVVQQSEHRK